MCELAKENLSLRSQLCQLKSLTSEDIVSKTALKLRDDIQKQELSKTGHHNLVLKSMKALFHSQSIFFF